MYLFVGGIHDVMFRMCIVYQFITQVNYSRRMNGP